MNAFAKRVREPLLDDEDWLARANRNHAEISAAHTQGHSSFKRLCLTGTSPELNGDTLDAYSKCTRAHALAMQAHSENVDRPLKRRQSSLNDSPADAIQVGASWDQLPAAPTPVAGAPQGGSAAWSNQTHSFLATKAAKQHQGFRVRIGAVEAGGEAFSAAANLTATTSGKTMAMIALWFRRVFRASDAAASAARPPAGRAATTKFWSADDHIAALAGDTSLLANFVHALCMGEELTASEEDGGGGLKAVKVG